MQRWSIHQQDVKNVFLHGFLNESINMEKPLGYVDLRFPSPIMCTAFKRLNMVLNKLLKLGSIALAPFL